MSHEEIGHIEQVTVSVALKYRNLERIWAILKQITSNKVKDTML